MKNRRVFIILVLIALLAAIGIGREWILASMARWLDVGEAPRAADYVMVLPGGPEQRPFVAVAMVHAGLAHGVLTAETETDAANDEQLTSSTSETLRRILLLRGIREDQIQILPGRSNSTWTDALALEKFMQEHPQSTVAIVTHGFHTRRSRWVFRRVLGDDARRVYFISAPLDRIDPDSWWKTEEGLNIYLSEYSKFLIYWGSDPYTILSVLAVMIVVFVGWRRIAFRKRVSAASSLPASVATESADGPH